MRNLKVFLKNGTTTTVKLPKFGSGKGTEAWYRSEHPTPESTKRRILARGGVFVGTRQK